MPQSIFDRVDQELATTKGNPAAAGGTSVFDRVDAELAAHVDPQPSDGGIPETAKAALGFGAAKAFPGIVTFVNKTAKYAKPVAGAIGAIDASRRALKGDMVGAAASAVGTATGAATVVPRVAEAVQRATAPATPAAPKGAMHAITKAMTPAKVPGIIARGASTASRVAGPVGLAVSALTLPHDINQMLQAWMNDPNTDPENAERMRQAFVSHRTFSR